MAQIVYWTEVMVTYNVKNKIHYIKISDKDNEYLYIKKIGDEIIENFKNGNKSE